MVIPIQAENRTRKGFALIGQAKFGPVDISRVKLVSPDFRFEQTQIFTSKYTF